MIKKSIWAFTAAFFGMSSNAFADTNCLLSDFTVEVYDHGGVYLHGIIAGQNALFVDLCLISTVTPPRDCTSPIVSHRLSIALAAQASGKNLLLHYAGTNATCPGGGNSYVVVTAIRILN